MLINIAIDDVNDGEEQHAPYANQDANVSPPHVLYLRQQFIALPNISVAQFYGAIMYSHGLVRLSRQINLRRDGHFFALLPLAHRAIQRIIHYELLSFLPRQLTLRLGVESIRTVVFAEGYPARQVVNFLSAHIELAVGFVTLLLVLDRVYLSRHLVCCLSSAVKVSAFNTTL